MWCWDSTIQGYVGKHPWFGATVGRVANRIAKGKFTLDGKEYALEINDPPTVCTVERKI